jgi:signal transduction histidine kinase
VALNPNAKEEIYHRELDTLLRSSALINSSLNIEDVLDNAMKWAEEFMDAEASSVYELDPEKNQLFVRLARGEKKEPIRGITLQVGEGVAGFVAQTGKPLVIQDVTEEKRFSDKFDRFTGFKTRSMISVPLTLREKSIGVIQVINKRSGEPFTRNDLELLTGMAQQIAFAMENAKLYRRLEENFELTAQELKITQEKLIRSGRLAAMGHLVQGVAHEIRNPITTIGGFAQRIKRELDKDNRLHRYIDIVLDEAARLEKIVEEVREFTEVQTASLAPGDFRSVLDDLLNRFEPLAGRQGVEVIADFPDDIPLISMDTPQLVIALSNVIENALESMHSGGRLTLGVRRDMDSLSLDISDTGCGIPEADLDAVYDPFVTSKPRGAGLGLTMVHQIITNHQGEIGIRSAPNRGTTVTIQLPIPTDSCAQER